MSPVWRHGDEKRKERDGVSLTFVWHSGPPAGGPHDGLLAQW